MQIQLQEAGASDGVLDDAQLSRRRDGSRRTEIGIEAHVVVRRIEIRVIEELSLIHI